MLFPNQKQKAWGFCVLHLHLLGGVGLGGLCRLVYKWLTAVILILKFNIQIYFLNINGIKKILNKKENNKNKNYRAIVLFSSLWCSAKKVSFTSSHVNWQLFSFLFFFFFFFFLCWFGKKNVDLIYGLYIQITLQIVTQRFLFSK